MSVHDVAAFLLKKSGPMSAMKLQKLVYYAQAWALALQDRSLFDEEIQAWAYGPVVYELFDQHRGQFVVSKLEKGDPHRLDDRAQLLLIAVLGHYGKFDGVALSELTHAEQPWQSARLDTLDGRPSTRLISAESMASYYSRQPVPFQLEQ